MSSAQLNVLWLSIWVTHPSYGKFLTVEEHTKAEMEMRNQLEECVEIWERTFGSSLIT